MKGLDLRAKGGGDREAKALVRRFLGCLAAKDGAGASRFASETFEWFGRAVAREEWKGAAFDAYLRAEPMRFERIRPVPEDLVDHLDPSDDVFDGPLNPGDAVFLADLDRGGRASTCGVIVGDVQQKLRVRRVFDPMALAAALRRIGASEEA